MSDKETREDEWDSQWNIESLRDWTIRLHRFNRYL